MRFYKESVHMQFFDQVIETGAGATELLLGTLALRVKWLPQGCHIREAGDTCFPVR